MIDPKSLSVDYRELLSIPIRDRVAMVQNGGISEIINGLTPTQRAQLFPRYYEEQLPDVSGFIKALSGGLDRFNSRQGTGTATGETGTYGPGPGRGRSDSSTYNTKVPERYVSPMEKRLRKEYPEYFASGRAGLNEDSALIELADDTNRTMTALGIDARQYNAYRQGLANIESGGGTYNIIGGAGDHYSGAYQFGSDAMLDSARALGMEVPSREEFLRNPELQEKFLDQFTALNHKTLMKSQKYRDMSPEDKLKVLGYAHNQGGGGALEYLRTGQVGEDAFHTKGTAYSEEIGKQLEATKDTVVGTSVAISDEPLNSEIADAEFNAWLEKQTPDLRKRLIASINADIKKNGINTIKNEWDTMKKAMEAQGRVEQTQATAAATRKLPLQEDLVNTIGLTAQKLSEETGKNLKFKVWSGGQAAIGTAGPRTGSTEHDLGGAGDGVWVEVMPDGTERELTMRNPEDKEIMYRAGYHFARAGGRSVGLENSYMGDAQHLGISRNSDNPVHHGDKELRALVAKGKEEFQAEAKAKGWNPETGYKDYYKQDQEMRAAEAAKKQETEIVAAQQRVEQIKADATNMPANKPFSLAKGSRIDNMKQELKKNVDANDIKPKAMGEQKLEAPRDDRAPVESPPTTETPTAEPKVSEPLKNQAAMTQGTQSRPRVTPENYSGIEMATISPSQARAYNRVGENLHRDGTSYV